MVDVNGVSRPLVVTPPRELKERSSNSSEFRVDSYYDSEDDGPWVDIWDENLFSSI